MGHNDTGIRSFTALLLPAGLQDEAAKVISDCRKICPVGIKWVEQENLHTTVQFFGDVAPEKLEVIKQELQSIFRSLPTFTVSKPRIEVFPRPENNRVQPRLVWLQFAGGSNSLGGAVESIRKLLTKLEIPVDNKPFKMHVTLGRIKHSLPLSQLKALEAIEINNKDWQIAEAALFASKLLPDGPKYIKLQSYSLNKEITE